MSSSGTATLGSSFLFNKVGMNSLRVRQMVSMLVLVALGVSLLGGGYLSLYSNRLMNEIMLQQEEVAAAIVVSVPMFSDDKIKSEDDTDMVDQLVSRYKFSREFEDDGSKHEYFAYIESANTGYLRWQSKFPQELSGTKDTDSVLQDNLVKQFDIRDDLAIGKPLLRERFLRPYTEGATEPLKFIVYSKLINVDNELVRLVIAKSAIELSSDSDHVQKNIIALFFSTLALVLVSQLISNYFIITPIRDFEKEVKQIEAGAQKAIQKAYPVELMEVKSAINTLINVEKGQKKRYRESLENLAHSLKTPLAGLLATAQSKYTMKNDDQEDLMAAINHMCDIVAYQLKRAAVRAPNAMIEQVILRPVLYRLRDSLYKVYHEKNFEIIINIDEYDKVRMEADDIIELFGNLMNNACRFCHEVVEIHASSDTNFLILDIDDDGMGFGIDSPSELLKRGMRDDSKTEGQGIGLAISTEIVEAVGGRIELQVSPQVGARVRLYLPR